MKNNMSLEFKVGIFTIIGILFFVVLGIHFSRSSQEVKGKDYYLMFDFLNGLQPGAAVRYSGGILVGKVLSIEPYKNRARLHVVVSNKITVDNYTQFSIMSNGLLGEKYINVVLTEPSKDSIGDPPTPLPEDSVIEGITDGGMDKLLSGVTALAEQMGKVMVPLAQILTKLQETNELPRLLASLRQLVSSGTAVIESNRKSLASTLQSIQSIVNKIDKGKGALGKVLNDPVFARSLENIVDSIDILIAKISNNPLINTGSGSGSKSKSPRRR